jgi:hypothetical protein
MLAAARPRTGPDESGKVDWLDEVVTWGEPLRTCALSGKVAMAECLLHTARIEHRSLCGQLRISGRISGVILR